MQYRNLGKDPAMPVSVIALGMMSTAPGTIHADPEEARAAETVHAALEAGINLFDTAPGYGDGESERRLGRALRGSNRPRESYFVATKAGGATLSAREIKADCEASLQRLGMDYIDLYQIHWCKRTVPLAESLGAMEELRQAGKIRQIGMCNTGPEDAAESFRVARVASVQIVYNLLTRAVEFGVAELARQHWAGLLCYSPLGQGLLTGQYKSAEEVPVGRSRTRHFHHSRPQSRHGEEGFESQTFEAIRKVEQIASGLGMPMADLAVAWLLHQPGVASVLCGASRASQVQANARTAEITLSPDTLTALDEATGELKRCMGPNLDPWQGNAVSRCR